MNKAACLLFFLPMALMAPALPGAEIETRHLQSLGEVDYLEFSSNTLGRPLHVFVDLPEDYAGSRSQYPAVFLLDGGNTFPLLAAQHHYLRFGNEAPAAILVGISYGADTYREGNMRQTDFTAPSADRDFWGGAGAFQHMLEKELLPMIERRYRADPARRILFGQSLGAQFVLYSALTRPELFYGHIASNPALHRNLPFFMEWQGTGDMPCRASRLFVSSGALEAETFREPTDQWISHWQARERRPWKLDTRTLPGQTHFSATPEAFRQGLAWIFSGD